MAITIDWGTRVIFVPQDFLTPVGEGLYGLDVNALRVALKSLEDDEEGMVFLDTHRHSLPLTLAGVTYARGVEIINGYTVEFENGQYTVVCSGANHNLSDVKVPNSVSLVIGNAAGLIVHSVGSGLSTAEHDKLMALPELDDIEGSDTLAKVLGLVQHNFRLKSQVYDADNNLVAGRVRIYASAVDALADENPIGEYQLAATFAGPGQCISYVMAEV
jgi:hypothetical protein